LLALLVLSHGLSLLHLRVPTPLAELAAAQAVELSRPRQRLHCQPELLSSSASSAPFLEKREQGEKGIYPSKRIIRVLFAILFNMAEVCKSVINQIKIIKMVEPILLVS
jgi:hypothetical protein